MVITLISLTFRDYLWTDGFEFFIFFLFILIQAFTYSFFSTVFSSSKKSLHQSFLSPLYLQLWIINNIFPLFVKDISTIYFFHFLYKLLFNIFLLSFNIMLIWLFTLYASAYWFNILCSVVNHFVFYLIKNPWDLKNYSVFLEHCYKSLRIMHLCARYFLLCTHICIHDFFIFK